MKKLFIAVFIGAISMAAIAQDYTAEARSTFRERLTGMDDCWGKAMLLRAQVVYYYEQADFARQQRKLLKKQEALLDIQTELAKEQLRTIRNAGKVVGVYTNLLDSMPAILSVAKRYESMQRPDKEITALMKIWEAATKLIKRPLTTEDLSPVVDSVLRAEGRIK